MSGLIVWGAGALGQRVGRLWREGAVLAYTATTVRHAELRAAGMTPATGAPAAVPDDAALLLALPGHAHQGEAVETLQRRGIRAPRRVVLISTTGYYGTPFGTVDEDTPTDGSVRSAGIQAVEEKFRAWAGERAVILRMGGLYGPGRGPGAALARRGAARPGPANRTLPLIHYDDAATAVAAALTLVQPEPVYLVVTPPCPTRGEFYSAAYAQLGLGTPDFETPLPHAPAVYNVAKLRRDLLPQPRFPGWHAALPEPAAHSA